jgi:hypothetical protein
MSKRPTYRRIFRFVLLALPILISNMVQFQATAENRYVQAPITLEQLERAGQEILPVAGKQYCAQYASSAVDDYRKMREHKKCFIRDNARWQPNYQNHYQWCLTAQHEWAVNEWKARDAHLVDCGVRFNY